MKTFLFSAMLMTLLSCNNNVVVYKNPDAPVEKRVDDLIKRMSLEEKVGQMNQFVGIEFMRRATEQINGDPRNLKESHPYYEGHPVEVIEKMVANGLVGSFLHVVTIEDANNLQKLAMESKLAIPLIFGIDAIHGNANAPDNTVYPTNIGLASTFDTTLAYKIARETALEMRAMNMHWTFNPNVEVARDARWGRVGETYGEDPLLVSIMGRAAVKGYQRDLNSQADVLACIKHFVGGSQPVNGVNAAPADISERTLREIFFPPFKSGVDAGAFSLMTAHNELNGVPCHKNEWLIKDILRGEWKFKGFIISDWMDIEQLHNSHATAVDLKEAFYQSIMAGVDMHMHGIYWSEMVCELVKEGRIPESRIDESVRKILYVKFKLGLFEKPYADQANSMKTRLSPEHRATALEAARKSIILLKNDSLLPIKSGQYKRILVTGINANDHNILGDWSAPQKEENVVTILEGIKSIAPESNITFIDQGWDPANMSPEKISKAQKAALSSDLNIVVAGDYMNRDKWSQRTCGENADRADINLVGLQEELIKKVYASGKPTILVLVSGRPLSVEWEAENIPAILNAWEPGMYGGEAVAEIIFGKVNPSAKLPITIPRNSGQIQIYYNQKPTHYVNYVFAYPKTPLYPFGFGLSYSKYEYSNMTLSKSEVSESTSITATVRIKNTGLYDGEEIVQLYIRDKYSSITRPVKELRDFARVALKSGEERVVSFEILPRMLEFLDKDFKMVIEPGEFEVMIGASSEDSKLLKATFNYK